jgi:hypothetical protein
VRHRKLLAGLMERMKKKNNFRGKKRKKKYGRMTNPSLLYAYESETVTKFP